MVSQWHTIVAWRGWWARHDLAHIRAEVLLALGWLTGGAVRGGHQLHSHTPLQERHSAARSAHLSALAMPRKQRPAATENGWPEPISGQNVELLGSLESPEDVDADRGQQR